MGNSQSHQQQDHMSYLAISPSPFASIVKRPNYGLSTSMKDSPSNRSSKPAQASVYPATDSECATRVQHKAVEINTLSILDDASQADWIPQVVRDRMRGGSREQPRLTGYLSRDSVVCSNGDSTQYPRREIYGRDRRTCTEVNSDEANTNALNTGEVNINEVKACSCCVALLHENCFIIQGSKQHTKPDVITYNEVNTSEADSNKENSDSVNSNEVNTRRNCIDSSHTHQCAKRSLQHKSTVFQCIDNIGHHDVNTDELNTDEKYTNRTCTGLHKQRYIVIQDTHRASQEVKSNETITNRDYKSSLHQQNCISTKNEIFRSPADNCDTFVKVEKISDAYISVSDFSEGKLVQYCLNKERSEHLLAGGCTFQLSMTESSLDEMAEADQCYGCGYLDSSCEDNQLVERGGSFEEKDHNGGDKKTGRGRNVHSRNNASVQQIEQGDAVYEHEDKLLRVTTDTVASQENKMNTDNLKCGSKFSSRIPVIATSNDVLNTNGVTCSERFSNGTSNTATSNDVLNTNGVTCSERFSNGTSNTATSNDVLNTNGVTCSERFSNGTSNTATSNDVLNTNDVTCSERFSNGTSNTATSNEHDRRCSGTFSSETSLVAAPNGNDLTCQLQTFSPSLGNNSTCESRLQTLQVYVHPGTGECHSMVFGSFINDGISLPSRSRTFSQNRECTPESVGYSVNHCDMSYGTGTFTLSSQEMADNASRDFSPDNQLGVHVGRAGLFDSFRDSVRSRSLEHAHPGRGQLQADHNADTEKGVIELPQNPCTEAGGSGENPQAWLSSQKAISSCESCSIVNSCKGPVFGCSSGSLCQMCSNHQQSLAENTASFSEAASSECRSQQSCDSWWDPRQMAGGTQTINSCFLDYDSDSCEFIACRDQQIQLKNDCKCERDAANKDRGQMFMNTDQEIKKCEVATEDFGLKSQISPPTLTFGEKSLVFCKNIIKSQRLAENEIRGMDTGEFNDKCAVYSTASSLTPSQNKLTANSVSCCDKHKRVTQADVGCQSVSRQFSKEAACVDPAKTENRSSATSSSASKQINSSTLTNSDNGRQFRGPLCLDDSDQADGSRLPYDDDADPSSADLDNIRRNQYQNHARHNGRHAGQEAHVPELNRVRQELANVGPEPCLLRVQHNRSLSCDCRYPFRQNYVAYLCCAPEDLSSFGLTFHRMLERWGFRIFIAPRDLELTGPKYDNMARWLEERCNGKIIVILSKNYEKSDECLFLTYFARTLDPDSKYRNIIPVVIDRDVDIPNVLKGLSIIKYNYDFRCGWLKKKLVNAIAA